MTHAVSSTSPADRQRIIAAHPTLFEPNIRQRNLLLLWLVPGIFLFWPSQV